MSETVPQGQSTNYESLTSELAYYYDIDDATRERMQAVPAQRINTNYEPGKWRRSLTTEEAAEVATAILYEKMLDSEEAFKSGSLSKAEWDETSGELAGASYFISYSTVHHPDNIIGFLKDTAQNILHNNPDLADEGDALAMNEAVRILEATSVEATKRDCYIEEHNIRVGRNAQREADLTE